MWGAVIFCSPDLDLHYGIEPNSEVSSLVMGGSGSDGEQRKRLYTYRRVAALDVLVVAMKVLIVRPISDDSAFGIFFRFQVTDFDRFLGFFSLCHFMFPSYFFGCFWFGLSQ